MKKVAVAVAGLLVAGALGSVATAGQGDSARGGGQILLGTDPETAGNTIAFTIEDNGDGTATGQFQYVDRSGGTGQGQDGWHGTPVCLSVDTNVAKAVIERSDQGNQGESTAGDLYELYIVDNGQGDDPDDMVTLTTEDTDPGCGEEDNDDDNQTALGRGNVQVEDRG